MRHRAGFECATVGVGTDIPRLSSDLWSCINYYALNTDIFIHDGFVTAVIDRDLVSDVDRTSDDWRIVL